jgi:hypothetical protein
MTITEKDLISKAEWLAIPTLAAHHRLVLIVAHGVVVRQELDERCVTILHIEEGHRLPVSCGVPVGGML